jgi:hypothetical protein
MSAYTKDGFWAIWLQLGWPVESRLLQLSGRYCAVEDTVNASNRGHFGSFLAGIEQIRLIEASTATREKASLISELTQ